MEFPYLTSRDTGGKATKSVDSTFGRSDLASCTVIRNELRGSHGKFLVFKDRKELSAAYERLDPDRRAWHEVIFGWQPQRLKFDIDAPADKLAKLPSSVIKAGLQLGTYDIDKEFAELLASNHDCLPDSLVPGEAHEPQVKYTTDDAAIAVVNLLIEAVLAELMLSYVYSGAAKISPSRLDMAISSSSGDVENKGYKYSYHLLVLPYAVSSCVEAQEFSTRVLDSLPAEVRALVDPSVNRRTQCFRLELSAKSGSNRIKKASNEVAEVFGTAMNQTYMDLFVAAAPGARILPDVYCAEQKTAQQATQRGVVALTTLTIDNILEVASDAARQFRLNEVRGTLLSFKRKNPSFCRLCSETHHKDNSLLLTLNVPETVLEAPDDTLISCTVIERCRQAPNKTAELGVVLITASELRRADPYRPQRTKTTPVKETGVAERILNGHIGAIKAFKEGSACSIKPHDPHISAVSLFESIPEPRCQTYSEPAMRDFELVPTLAVLAQMKLGKTKALRRYIERYFPAEGIDPPVIRFVTFRQTFSRAIQESFPDFTLYSDAPAGASLGVVNYPRLIVQVESLHRLPAPRGADGVLDLLVLDEVESILAQFNSGLHRNFSAAFAIFQWMLMNARYVVVMDANLSDRSWSILANMRPQHPPHFHWNKFLRAAGDHYQFTMNQGAWLSQLWSELQRQQRIVIPTNSLAEARTLEAEIRRGFPERSIMLYSSEMTPSERSRHFANVHEYWGKLDVLIYTPTCSAGVSFELARFDVLFGLFTDRSCDVETCRQMLGRVRNLARREHFICFQSTRISQPGGLPETISDIRDSICDKRSSLFRNEAAGPFAALGFEYSPDGMPGFYETQYFKLWLETTRIENLSKNNFIRRFIDQTADSGAGIVPWPIEPEPEPEAARLITEHKTIRKSQKAAQNESVALSVELTAEEAEDIRQSMTNGQDVSMDQRMSLEKWHLRNTYVWHGRPIDAPFTKNYSTPDARRVYRNLTMALSASTVREALMKACGSEALRYATSMELRTESTAVAIEGRELLRDRYCYTSFGLLLALWMLNACGFNDFMEIRYVHICELEWRLRSLLPAIDLHKKRAVNEFDNIRLLDTNRLCRETDVYKFVSAVLQFINSILRSAFGVQVSKLSVAAGGDAYYVSWSTTGELFALVESNQLPDPLDLRPHIMMAFKRLDIAKANTIAARGLFMDRQYYDS